MAVDRHALLFGYRDLCLYPEFAFQNKVQAITVLLTNIIHHVPSFVNLLKHQFADVLGQVIRHLVDKIN
jgi:hypothetical protein